MLHVKSEAGQEWQIAIQKNEILVDNEPFNWNILPIGPQTFHIIHNNNSFTAEVLSADYQAKTFEIKVNGHKHVIEAKDRFDLLLDKLGMGQANAQRLNDLKAPMPGLILDVKVEVGQEVKKGDTVLILEAMKMENIIKSPGDAVVKAINVEVRQNVEKGQVLIVF